MVYQQESTDFSNPTRSKTPDMANASFTGTFPRMRDKGSVSRQPLGSIKSASTWNLTEGDGNKQSRLENGSSISNILDIFKLRPSSRIYDKFGICDNNLYGLVPPLEQTWRNFVYTNNNSKHDRGTNEGESGCSMTAVNLLNETFKNSSDNNTLFKQKLALALELQNVMYTLE